MVVACCLVVWLAGFLVGFLVGLPPSLIGKTSRIGRLSGNWLPEAWLHILACWLVGFVIPYTDFKVEVYSSIFYWDSQ